MSRPNTAESFWRRVVRSDGCWLWQGARQSHGYGSLGWHGRVVQAHRLAYELTYGPIPAGMSVRHICDVMNCCRPDHLVLGTQRDNIADMVARNRTRKGEQRPQAKLRADDVRLIRRLYARGDWSMPQLAARFNISDTQIHAIIARLAWRHVPEEPMADDTVAQSPPTESPRTVTPKEPQPRAPRRSRPLAMTCSSGHPYTPENTIVLKSGGRRCRTCWRSYWNAWYARRRQSSASSSSSGTASNPQQAPD